MPAAKFRHGTSQPCLVQVTETTRQKQNPCKQATESQRHRRPHRRWQSHPDSRPQKPGTLRQDPADVAVPGASADNSRHIQVPWFEAGCGLDLQHGVGKLFANFSTYCTIPWTDRSSKMRCTARRKGRASGCTQAHSQNLPKIPSNPSL